MGILDGIKQPGDIKRLDERELADLAAELRQVIIDTTQENGGHMASNLGVVELTIALHRALDLPKDKIVWDVGHQSYAHKLLSGRKEQFGTLRQYGGIAGFPKVEESEYDAFNTGHASTSISAALGLVRARDLSNEDNTIVAVLGDGALSGGLSYEALNDAGASESGLIVILNDNEMSISHNVGGMNTYLSRMRSTQGYTRFKRGVQRVLMAIPLIGKRFANFVERTKNRVKYFVLPSVYFEEIGFTYLGPISGHDIKSMQSMISHAKALRRPVFIHVVTQKGRGYKPAEQNPEKYHGVAPFLLEKNGNGGKSCSAIMGETLLQIATTDRRVVAITAAMESGTGLSDFAKRYPERFFDVGIAEQHAITMAAGMAMGGLRPYCAIYSSFLQRGYDQILHDVCAQKLPVTLCIDRAGIVGEDGETHQGLFDISMLNAMPNMVIASPATQLELQQMVKQSLEYDGPFAIRYPRGSLPAGQSTDAPVVAAKWDMVQPPQKITVIATGRLVEQAKQAVAQANADGIACGFINARFIKPLDIQALSLCVAAADIVITVEDGMLIGGLGNSISQWCANHAPNTTVRSMGIDDQFVPQGDVQQLLSQYGLCYDGIYRAILAAKGERAYVG
ncbi:1-deoxy-D-xylulose-5-phosphate synthase [Eubacteriales bacterium OttesenSCG-928-N14]|nr:1-deoxy-D-xylulose-5-phosphate synthase [Eubacteriales bacterium OttesenSCG-928-N14]